MPLLSDVVAYQSSVDDISTVAIAELLAFWRVLGDDPVAIAAALREFMPDLVDTYQPVSSEIAAQFYDDTRVLAGVTSQYDAKLTERPAGDKIQVNLGWALEPLFRRAPDGKAAPDRDLSISRSGSLAQLAIADGARETIDDNISADPATPRYARHASANACAFCALMASRGAVYRSETSAAGRKWHAHCHCVAYPVFPGEKDDSAPYVANWDRAYIAARKSAIADGVKPDLNGVLRYMRRSLGAA